MPRPKFKKGNPGGPGRPPGSKNGSTRAIEWAEKYGWQFLCDVAMGKPVFAHEVRAKDGTIKRVEHRPAGEGTRTDISKYLMDRAYGKPTQATELSGALSLEQILTKVNPE